MLYFLQYVLGGCGEKEWEEGEEKEGEEEEEEEQDTRGEEEGRDMHILCCWRRLEDELRKMKTSQRRK